MKIRNILQPVLAIRISAQTSIALASAAIASCSLVLTYWTALQQRQHDRLSVVPYLRTSFYYSQEKGLTLELSNSGIGPAKLHQYQVYLDGKRLDTWDSLVLAYLPETASTGSVQYQALVGRGVLGSQKSVTMFGTKDPLIATKLRDGASRLSFHICYCSFYDECWIATNTEPKRVELCERWEPASIEMGKSFNGIPLVR